MKLVYVKWVDSCSTSGWQSQEDAPCRISLVCESFGHLVNEEEDRITVAGHRFEATEQVCGSITIPREAIKEFYEVEME